MSELKRRTRWKKWAPDIGENRDERPEGPLLFLEIQVDLTAEQLEAMAEQQRSLWAVEIEGESLRERVARINTAVLEPHVRVFGGPHTVNEKPLATIADYVRLVGGSADFGLDRLRELQAAVVSFNSISGPDELFSARRSGGARSTDAKSNEKAASPTDDR